MTETTIAPQLNRMLIGGGWQEAMSGGTIDVENPATRSIVGSVPRGTAEDVDAAVEAARRAFPAWSRVSTKERTERMLAIADHLEQVAEEVARITATETGNALRTQARPEAWTAVDLFRYFAGVVSETKGETVPLTADLLSYTVREPLGVVGGIIP